MNHHFYYIIVVLLLLSSGCQRKSPKREALHPKKAIIIKQDAQQKKSMTAQKLDSLGMMNIAEADSTIIVSLMYSRSDNFTKRVLYNELKEAYLHPKAARALLRAQKILKKTHPEYTLIVFDAARPMHIQQKMWKAVRGTHKNIYVSNPAHGGGLHNYGLAVDISMANAKGDTIDMGTKVDYMGTAAHIDNEQYMANKGIISKKALHNRRLLRRVMRQAGFRALHTEWWHFNYCSRKVAKKYYKIIP
jgi:D-alanyl-D-alanine dipeptidase